VLTFSHAPVRVLINFAPTPSKAVPNPIRVGAYRRIAWSASMDPVPLAPLFLLSTNRHAMRLFARRDIFDSERDTVDASPSGPRPPHVHGESVWKRRQRAAGAKQGNKKAL
jgi:hypothetical protein